MSTICSAPVAAIPVSSIAVGDVVLHLRRLGTGDLRAIAQHLLVLGLPDRRSRFLGNLADAAVSAYARRLDPLRAILIGAFDPGERLVGLAEAHPTDTVGKVEVAVSIDAAAPRCARPGAGLWARRAVGGIQLCSRQSPVCCSGAGTWGPVRPKAWLRFDRS
ncbi:MAG: hypothetical protein WA723_22690 [Pseudolabrys sp.]